VQTLLAQHGPSTPVVITGHSLGAALALLNTVYLSLHLPAGTSLSMIGYGLPRVGNAAFADYVDATANVTHVNNRADPVTILPPEFVGFRHPAGEIHIDRESGAWNVCPGQDNPSKLCVAGHVPTVLKGNVMDHVGPYDEGILMGWC
jgi:Lipase (class 3)